MILLLASLLGACWRGRDRAAGSGPYGGALWLGGVRPGDDEASVLRDGRALEVLYRPTSPYVLRLGGPVTPYPRPPASYAVVTKDGVVTRVVSNRAQLTGERGRVLPGIGAAWAEVERVFGKPSGSSEGCRSYSFSGQSVTFQLGATVLNVSLAP